MQSNIFDKIVWPENPKKGNITLHPYQKKALVKVSDDYLHSRSKRQLIVLCVGLGKTITAASIADFIFEHKQKPVLFLAHRDELLEQAISEFELYIGKDFLIETEQAEKEATLGAHVVMASVQTIGRDGSKRIQKFPRDHFGAIIIDEAHHSSSDTYQRVINYFMDCEDKPLLVGITATPQRGDKESLDKIFDTVAINLGIVDATKQGYATPIISYRVSSQTDLFSVRTTAGDFNLKDLAEAVNNKERNTLIVETYVKRFPDKQALVFCTDLDHIARLEEEFQSVGISAAGVTGNTDKKLRKEIIRKFKSGEIKVCLNYGVLTEGYNHKELDLIIQARPTQSMLLLNQISGRATRIIPQKSAAHIVEIIDHHSGKTATVAKIFGFRQEFDCEGHDYLDCMNTAERLSGEKDFFNPYNCSSYSDMLARYEKSTPTNPKGFDGAEFEVHEKERKQKEDVYSEFDPNNDYFDMRYRYFYHGQNLKMLFNDKEEMLRYQVIAYPNGLGGFDVLIARKPEGSPKSYPAEKVIQYRGASVHDAIKKSEEWILKNKPEMDHLLNVNASWRKKAATQPCSDKQWFIVSKNRLSSLTRDKVSKDMASNLISGFFSRK